MPPKKLKKFCGLTKFIQQNDKDLYQALDDLCLFGLFRPRGRGVTFLYPSDKAYRKKIIDHAYSNNPEKAVDMVRALVLLDYLPAPADFKNKKDDISNALHKKLEVESADSKEVKLKSGHKLIVDSSYAHLRDGDPVAVYMLTGKGELPTTGTASVMKYNNTKTDTRGGSSKSNSIIITECVENIYESGNHEIFKTVMAIIYSYAVENDDSGSSVIYNKLCASARASFYNVIAPWYLEKDNTIDNMLNVMQLADLIKCDSPTIMKLITEWSPKYNEKLKGLIEKVGGETNTTERDNVRVKLLTSIKDPTTSRMKVLEAYGNNKDKLYKDLLTMYCYLAAINEDDDSTYFKTTFKFVMKHIFNHNDSFNESVNETVYNLSLYYNLVKSDAFLYKPVYDKSQISPSYTDLQNALPNPNDPTLFTIQFNDVLIEKYGGSDNSFFGGLVNNL